MTVSTTKIIPKANLIDGVWTGDPHCACCAKPAENLYRKGTGVIVGCVSCAAADHLTDYLGRVNNAESQAAVAKVSHLVPAFAKALAGANYLTA